MKNKMKSVFPFVVLFGCLIVFIIFMQFVKFRYSSNLASLDNQIQDIQMEMESIRVGQAQQQSDVTRAVSGLDTARVEHDQSLIQKFLKDFCTWENLDVYQTKVNRLKELYPEDDNQVFYTFFADSTDTNNSLNMTYLENDSVYVINITDSDYTYFTEVTVSSNTSSGETGTGKFIFECTVGSDGSFSNLSAYAITLK